MVDKSCWVILLSIFVLLATCTPWEVKGLELCDFSNICTGGNLSEYSESWFEPRKQYNYVLNTSQRITVVSHRLRQGISLEDSQTIYLRGLVSITRRTGAEACAIDVVISNLTVSYVNIDTNIDVTSPFKDSIHAAYALPGSTNTDVSQNICLSHKDQWKDNLVRSIVSAININKNVLTIVEKLNELDLHSEPAQPTTYPSRMTLYGRSSAKELRGFRFLTSPGMPNDGLPPHKDVSPASDVDTNSVSYSDILNFVEEKDKFPQYGFQTFAVKCNNTNFGPGVTIEQFNGKEEQINIGGSQMVTNITTHTMLTLLNVEKIVSTSFSAGDLEKSETLFWAPLKWDVTPPKATNDSEPINHFLAALSEICKLNGNSDTVEFVEKMRKLASVMPTHILREGEDLIQKMTHCSTGLDLYYSVLASCQSDDTVEFVVEHFLSGGGNPGIFKGFMWSSMLMPSTLPEEEPYAGSRAVSAVTQLFHNREQLAWKVDEKNLLLAMVGFLKKIRTKDALRDTNFNTILTQYIETLDGFIAQDSVDIGTRLEARKLVDALLEERGLNYVSTKTTCSQMAGSNVYHLLKCLGSCQPILSQLLESVTLTDVQVLAYISMRKCPDFVTRWKPVLAKFLENEGADEEVKKFIIHHSHVINDPILSGSSSADPEPSKVGRTWYRNLEVVGHSEYSISNYSYSWLIELNVVMGMDSLPRMIRIDLAYWSIYGMDRFYETELLRSSSENSSNPGKFDIYYTHRESGDITVGTRMFSLDFPKMLEKLQEYKSKLNDKSESDRSGILALIKAKIDKLFENREIRILKTILLENRIQQFPTMSGLAFKSGIQFDGAISFNYKSSVSWKNNEFFSIFEINLTFTLERTETATLGFGHNENIGYEVGAHNSFTFNFGVNVTTQDDQRTILTKLIFSPPQDGDDDENKVFFKNDLKFLKLSRIQYVDSYTSVRKSDHVWNSENYDYIFNKTTSDRTVELVHGLALLDKGKYIDKWIKFEKPNPFYYSRETTCSLPNIFIRLKLSVGTPGKASLEVKVNPDNATEANTYSGHLRILANRKENSFTTTLEITTPGQPVKFEVKLAQGMSEKSLRLAAIVGRTEAGVELFLKHNRLKTDKAPYVIARRKRNALKIPNAGVEVNDPWSHKIYEFGVKGWHRTGTSSSNVAGVTPTVQGALIFVEKELFSTWVMLDSDGILPVLDSKLNLSFSTRRNVTRSIKVNQAHAVIPVASGDVTKLNFDITNERLIGSVTVLGEQFSTNNPHISEDGSVNYVKLHSGFAQISHRGNGSSSSLLAAEYTGFEINDGFVENISDVKSSLKRCNIFGTIESSTIPLIHTNFDYWLNVSNDLNTTASLDMQPIHFPAYHLNARCSMVGQNVSLETSLGHDAWVNISKGEFCSDLSGGVECRHVIEMNMERGIVVYSSHWDWTYPRFEQSGSHDYTNMAFINFRKLNRATDSGYECNVAFNMTDFANSLEARMTYNGTFVNQPTGPKYSWNGNYVAETFVQNHFVTATTVRELQGELKEESLKEPISIYYHDDSGVFLLKRKTIFLINDTNNVYVDLNLSYDFTEDRDDKVQLVSASLMTKDYVTVKLDATPAKIAAMTEVIPLDFNVNVNLVWSEKTSDKGGDDISSFKGSITSFSLQNPRLRYVALETENELEDFPVTKSIQNVLEGVNLPLWSNVRIFSKTYLRIKSISQKVTLAVTFFPDEKIPTPALFLEWVLPTADKFLIQVKKQFVYAHVKDRDVKLSDSATATPCLVLGHWIKMDQPGYESFSSDMLLKTYYLQKKPTADGKFKQLYDVDAIFNYSLHHHEFFVPYFDTHFRLNGNLKITQDGSGTENDESNSNDNSSPKRWDEFSMSSFSNKLEITLNANGRQQFPETNLGIEANQLLKASEMAAELTERNEKVIRAYFKNNMVHHEAHISMNSSAVPASSTISVVDLADNSMDSCLRTVTSQNGILYSRRNDFGYGFSSKNLQISGNAVFDLEGEHKLTRIYKTWRKFEVGCNHIIKSTFFNTTWEDKIYSSIEPTANTGIIGAYSTKLFNLTLERKDPSEGSLTLNIIPEPARTLLVTKFVRSLVPREQTLKWDLHCDSAFFHSHLEVEILHRCFKKLDNPLGPEHVTKMVYSIPHSCNGINETYTGQLDSFLQHYFLEMEDRVTAEVVAHVLSFTRVSHPVVASSSLKFGSTTTVLIKDHYPVFIHRDFTSNGLRNGTDWSEFEGSMSVSAPTPSAQQPQVAQVTLNYDMNEPRRSGNFEVFLRLGRVPSTFLETCDFVNADPISFLSSELHPYQQKIIQLTPEILNQTHYRKLYCEKCDNDGSKSLSCSESFGTLVAERRQNSTSRRTALLVQKEDRLVANWSQDECKASQFSSKSDSTPATRKNLSKGCTSMLTKMKERHPCWFDQGIKCDKSAKARSTYIWNKIVGQLKPLKITVVMDSMLVFAQLLVE